MTKTKNERIMIRAEGLTAIQAPAETMGTSTSLVIMGEAAGMKVYVNLYYPEPKQVWQVAEIVGRIRKGLEHDQAENR